MTGSCFTVPRTLYYENPHLPLREGGISREDAFEVSREALEIDGDPSWVLVTFSTDPRTHLILHLSTWNVSQLNTLSRQMKEEGSGPPLETDVDATSFKRVYRAVASSGQS